MSCLGTATATNGAGDTLTQTNQNPPLSGGETVSTEKASTFATQVDDGYTQEGGGYTQVDDGYTQDEQSTVVTVNDDMQGTEDGETPQTSFVSDPNNVLGENLETTVTNVGIQNGSVFIEGDASSDSGTGTFAKGNLDPDNNLESTITLSNSNEDGTTTETITVDNEFDPDGNLINAQVSGSRVEEGVDFDGMGGQDDTVTTEFYFEDSDGNLINDRETTSVSVDLESDGTIDLQTETTKTFDENGELTSSETTSTGTTTVDFDGDENTDDILTTTTTEIDSDGDGNIDTQTTELSVDLDGDGTIDATSTQTDEFDASGNLIRSETTTTATTTGDFDGDDNVDDTLTYSTTFTDEDGDGIVDSFSEEIVLDYDGDGADVINRDKTFTRDDGTVVNQETTMFIDRENGVISGESTTSENGETVMEARFIQKDLDGDGSMDISLSSESYEDPSRNRVVQQIFNEEVAQEYGVDTDQVFIEGSEADYTNGQIDAYYDFLFDGPVADVLQNGGAVENTGDDIEMGGLGGLPDQQEGQTIVEVVENGTIDPEDVEDGDSPFLNTWGGNPIIINTSEVE